MFFKRVLRNDYNNSLKIEYFSKIFSKLMINNHQEIIIDGKSPIEIEYISGLLIKTPELIYTPPLSYLPEFFIKFSGDKCPLRSMVYLESDSHIWSVNSSNIIRVWNSVVNIFVFIIFVFIFLFFIFKILFYFILFFYFFLLLYFYLYFYFDFYFFYF